MHQPKIKTKAKKKNGENPTDCQKWNTHAEALEYKKLREDVYVYIYANTISTIKQMDKKTTFSLFLSVTMFASLFALPNFFFLFFHDFANPSMLDFDRKTFCNPHIFLYLGCNVMLLTCTISRLTAQWSRQKLTNYLLDMEVDMRLLFVGFIFWCQILHRVENLKHLKSCILFELEFYMEYTTTFISPR